MNARFLLLTLSINLVLSAGTMASELHLDTLDLSLAQSGWSQTRAKRSIDGNPIRINGRTFERGIGTHANGSVRIGLDGRATRFKAMVGVDEEVKGKRGTVTFKVVGDGKLLWQSPVMKPEHDAVAVDVPLSGCKSLVLVSDGTADGIEFDHADWADAVISFEGSQPVMVDSRIRLETADTQLNFEVQGTKLLLQYFGPRLADPLDAKPANQNAYPSQWDIAGFENAIAIIQADGKLSLDLQYRDHTVRDIDTNRTEAVFKLADPVYLTEVDLHYIANKAENVIETWSVVRNPGKAPVVVDHAASGFLNISGKTHYLTTFSGSWGGESLMDESLLTPGVREIGSRAGTRTSQIANPAFVLSTGSPAREEEGEVLMGALAWSGNWNMRFEKVSDSMVSFTAGYHPYLSRYQLASGESLETPRLILTRSMRGKGQASRNLHRWARAYGVRGGHEKRRILLNSWEGAYFTFNDELIKRMISDAAKTGIELFVLDDGWFGTKHPRDHSEAGLGDWVENRAKLKDGIQGLIDHAKKEGIDFGIWVEPEMVNPRSELYEQHPDWVIELPNREKRLQRTQLGLDLSNPAVQEYIFKVMDDLLGQHPGVSYVKWDCNRAISDPGSNFLAPDRQERLWVDYVKGYYSVLDRITKKYPEVTFQVCGSGGGRTDYGSLRFHDEAWTSDNTDALERLKMQWGLNHIYPAIITAAHVTEVPSHQTLRSTPIKFRFDVAMTGRLGFELRPERVPAADMEFSKRALDVYKDIRPIVQFGDLYRLKSPYEGDLTSLMYVSSEANKPREAVFFAFATRTHILTDHGAIQLRGLDPAKRYRITEINTAKDGVFITRLHDKVLGGDTLMTQGIRIPWGKGDYQSAVLKLVEIPAN